MKTLIIFMFAVLTLTACGGSGGKEQVVEADASIVYVYYFHGKQRCKTCMAVEDVARQTIAEAFAGNNSVKFVEVKTDEQANGNLVEKYEVTWNALIIAKGDDVNDITEQAFATAVNSPDELAKQIIAEVKKRL